MQTIPLEDITCKNKSDAENIQRGKYIIPCCCSESELLMVEQVGPKSLQPDKKCFKLWIFNQNEQTERFCSSLCRVNIL